MISASPIEVHAVRVSELSLVSSLVMGLGVGGRTSTIGARPPPTTPAPNYWCRWISAIESLTNPCTCDYAASMVSRPGFLCDPPVAAPADCLLEVGFERRKLTRYGQKRYDPAGVNTMQISLNRR
jgi:hypothetical protein